MYFNAEVRIRDFLTTVSLDAKMRFNYLIELGNTTSDWTTGDDVYTRAKGVEVLCSMNVCVWDHTWVSVCHQNITNLHLFFFCRTAECLAPFCHGSVGFGNSEKHGQRVIS